MRGAQPTTQVPKPIRVVVGEAARMLRDIVERAITLQPDMELIRVANGDAAAAAHWKADVAIVLEPPAAGDRVPEALLVNPRIKVIVLTDEGRSAHVVELCQHPVADVSPQGLVNAIRAAASGSSRNTIP